MPDLPARPDLDQLRRQAKELLRAARAGDPAAAARIRSVSARQTLTAARLAIAREHGFPSWRQLKIEADALAAGLAEQADAFLAASIGDGSDRAARMLAAAPELADYDFRTAVVLGNAALVGDALDRDPGLAARPDARTGWLPLHAVCASRWHRLDPARTAGMAEVARLLLDAGADYGTRELPGRGGQARRWSALFCAVAGASNHPVIRLLLERGARPDDHALYLAAFGAGTLRLLLPYAENIAETTALAAPISVSDTEAVRLLLAAGADASRPLPGDLFGERVPAEPPIPPVAAAVQAGCPVELDGLLLEHGGDPDAPGQDGRSPYQVAVRQGNMTVADLLARHGARDTATEADRFLSACRQGQRDEAERLLQRDPHLLSRLGPDDHAAITEAAGQGRTEAVRFMLDAGFPLEVRGQDGATALHAAAGSGSAETVRLLLDRGAGIEARDTTWDSTPLVWALVGSGLHQADNPHPDWPATVRTLIAAGASTAGITLSPDDPKPPSPEVARLLLSYGVPGESPESGGG
jgi:ankyrin repeat protein